MRGYLLDTHILLWFLTEPEKVNHSIYDDIKCFCRPYYVSIESLSEIVTLQRKRNMTALSIKEVVVALEKYNVTIIYTNLNHLEVLEKLSVPKIDGAEHKDPVDRILISQAIAEKLTLISADRKFPYYTDKGFDLIQN